MTHKNLTMFRVMLLKNVYARGILMKRYEDESVKTIRENVGVAGGDRTRNLLLVRQE